VSILLTISIGISISIRIRVRIREKHPQLFQSSMDMIRDSRFRNIQDLRNLGV
jgi:hypothetical protein